MNIDANDVINQLLAEVGRLNQQIIMMKIEINALTPPNEETGEESSDDSDTV